VPFAIAVAGKGGTGKTTVTALVIHYLLGDGRGPILAVDADPNANLGDLLGLEVEMTVGGLEAETLKGIRSLPAGMPLDRYMEYELHQALVEGVGVDLLAMGRGEGPGCYCAVNHILKRYLESIRGNYPYVILDNEAGMEHLSRHVTQGVDLLLLVSDVNPVAIRSAARINSLAEELDLKIKQRYLVLNNLRGEVPERVEEEIDRSGLEVLGKVPRDEIIATLNLEGRPITELPPGAAALSAMESMLGKALRKEERV
jgi:CO dehydrogenase maturation factor